MESIIFDWIINFECNFRCPYCWFHGQWESLEKFNKYVDKKAIMDFWCSIYRRHGAVRVNISGGEPFINSGFIDTIHELAKLHRVEVMSNVSLNVNYLLNKEGPAALEIVPSFHPLSADLDEFKSASLRLKERGWLTKVSYLAWPPLIHKINYFRDIFSGLGLKFFARPFFGIYGGKKYPEMYTDEEKAAIYGSVAHSGDMPPTVEPIKTKGRPCYAGNRYALIQPDGAIYRCGTTRPSSPEHLVIGHILEKGFKLFDMVQPCDAEECICNLWSVLLKRDKDEAV